MRYFTLLAALVCTVPALAQNWYVPDNSSTVGVCNVIPFGSGVGSSFYNAKMQTRLTAADLGALPNIITGLAFASCNTGRAHYDQIEIVLDHIPAAQVLSTTFDNNLTPAAVTVLNSTNYTWNVTADVWNEIGLQTFFVYNGVDDVVVQISSTNGLAPGGMRRGTRQRIYWTGATGPAAAVGLSTASATKIEASMLTAHTSSHGDGCVGSNGTPRLSFTGSAQINNTLSFDLTNGVQNGIALFFAGTTNAGPFPLELSFVGMPSCYAYTDLAATSALILDPTGAGSFPFPIPPTAIGALFYGQYAVLDPAANVFGFTTSNYGRVLTGN